MRHRLAAVILALVCASPAAAVDLPTRKAGLWEIKSASEGGQMPAQTILQCIDAATDKLMQEKFSGGGDLCSKQDMRKSGDSLVVESSCKIGTTAMKVRAVFEGDFQSAYTVKVSTTQEGAPSQPGGTTNLTMQAKWLGACKADQKPGDIEMPGGMKMNILDLPKTPAAPQR